MSANLNALSALTLYDFVRPIYLNSTKKELDEKISSTLSRMFGNLIFTLLLPFIMSISGHNSCINNFISFTILHSSTFLTRPAFSHFNNKH